MLNNRKIDFIGIGAQKCASSWVFDVLSDHPDVTVSHKKELDFFSYHYENGFDWYIDQFEELEAQKKAGEVSPSYFHEPGVPERVHAYSADVKIIVSLRDPVERALSQHRHLVRLGIVGDRSLEFENALRLNPTYKEQGRYAKHLKRWLDIFPRESIHILLMEDIVSDSRIEARRLYEFLGVSPDHLSKFLTEKSNPSYVTRNKQIEGMVRGVRRVFRSILGKSAWERIGNFGLRDAYRALNRKPSSAVIPEVSESALMTLRREFSDEVLMLEQLIGRDLRSWLPS